MARPRKIVTPPMSTQPLPTQAPVRRRRKRHTRQAMPGASALTKTPLQRTTGNLSLGNVQQMITQLTHRGYITLNAPVTHVVDAGAFYLGARA